MKNNFIPKILLGLAILGFLILWVFSIGRTRHSNRVLNQESEYINESKLYSMAIGITLMLPYIIYIFKSKPQPRPKLKGIDDYGGKEPAADDWAFFVLNKTGQTLMINRSAELDQNQWYVFQIKKNQAVYFSHGVTFYVDKDDHLVIEDGRNQIMVLVPHEFLKYKVPDFVHSAFVLTKPNKGKLDGTTFHKT